MSVPLLEVLAGKSLSPPPVWLMRQAGRYLPEYREARAKAGSFWTLCNSPELAAEVTLQPIRRFDFDAAIIFSDILTVPMALGHPVAFDEGPKLAPLNSLAYLERDSAKWRSVLEPTYEALGLTRQKLARDKALIGFAGGPWTLAVYLAGGGYDEQKAARLWAYRNPDGFQELIGLLVDCVSQHLIWQFEAGADVAQIFDSWAGGLPPALFDRFVIKPTKTIVKKVRAAVRDAPIIGFPRGADLIQAVLPYADDTGVSAVSLDPSASLELAAVNCGVVLKDDGNLWGVVLQGNLDPLALVAGGKALEDAVRSILHDMRDTPFIFNLGHGILPTTPVEHVEELVKLVRSGM
ncbi:MAG TPA: uroporphyrinogen decarboxylase [Rhizomicrobium sp.]|nr:uroporphyrinogen decarboxylase [Rhizomicrobium sp.]